MIKTAQSKFPEKHFQQADARNTPFSNNTFDYIICFHLFMHLNKNNTADIFREFHRILNRGGKVVFDIPSKRRRDLVNYKANNWHGANDFSFMEIKNMLHKNWTIKQYHGIAFFPHP